MCVRQALSQLHQMEYCYHLQTQHFLSNSAFDMRKFTSGHKTVDYFGYNQVK